MHGRDTSIVESFSCKILRLCADMNVNTKRNDFVLRFWSDAITAQNESLIYSFLRKKLLVMKFKKHNSPLQGIEPWSSVRRTVILPLYYIGFGILLSVFIRFRSEGHWTRRFWEMLVWKVWPCHKWSQRYTQLFSSSHTFVAQSCSEIGGRSSIIPYSSMYSSFITVFSWWMSRVKLVK